MNSRYYFLNKKLITIFSFIVIANCLLFFLYVKDVDREINKLIREEKSLESQIRDIEIMDSKATNIQNNLQEIDIELHYFYSQILGNKEEKLLDILKEIDLLAHTYGLIKRNISYIDTQLEKERLIQLDIVFPLTGRYSDIREFIYSIEESTYFLIIDRIELISLDRATDNINLNVHLRAYFSNLSLD